MVTLQQDPEGQAEMVISDSEQGPKQAVSRSTDRQDLWDVVHLTVAASEGQEDPM